MTLVWAGVAWASVQRCTLKAEHCGWCEGPLCVASTAVNPAPCRRPPPGPCLPPCHPPTSFGPQRAPSYTLRSADTAQDIAPSPPPPNTLPLAGDHERNLAPCASGVVGPPVVAHSMMEPNYRLLGAPLHVEVGGGVVGECGDGVVMVDGCVGVMVCWTGMRWMGVWG